MHADAGLPPTARAGQYAQATVRCEMIEHVMRLTDDDLLASPFLHSAPQSQDYLTHLGRLLASSRHAVAPDSPLHRYASNPEQAPDLTWRAQVPTGERSLWSELELLRQLHGEVNTGDPLTELHLLRQRS